MDWQPIETAPKDNQPVELTWLKDGKPQEIWEMHWGHINVFPNEGGMWRMFDGSFSWNDIGLPGPTHYRLPTPPETKS